MNSITVKLAQTNTSLPIRYSGLVHWEWHEWYTPERILELVWEYSRNILSNPGLLMLFLIIKRLGGECGLLEGSLRLVRDTQPSQILSMGHLQLDTIC